MLGSYPVTVYEQPLHKQLSLSALPTSHIFLISPFTLPSIKNLEAYPKVAFSAPHEFIIIMGTTIHLGCILLAGRTFCFLYQLNRKIRWTIMKYLWRFAVGYKEFCLQLIWPSSKETNDKLIIKWYLTHLLTPWNCYSGHAGWGIFGIEDHTS